MNPYENLANAIVERAVADYREALKRLKKHPHNQNALDKKDEIERFFRSGWFGVLTKLDPEMLLRKLSEEVA